MCGRWSSFPACTASVKIRFRIVSSRLISPFETPAIVRSCSFTVTMVPSFFLIS